jgi:5-methylcytosine-specific restriction endonuclease McrA
MRKIKHVVKSPRVPRTRNAGTLTEAAFWALIRSALREKSRWWKPIALAKKLAKRPYVGDNKRRKIAYECNHCKKLFAEENIAVDHIIPAGTLKCFEDLPEFVRKLFCEVDGLQVLCDECHNIKTKEERNGNNTEDS